MTDKNAILEALAKLDAANDDHWIAGGKPAMKVLEEMTGDKAIKRADVEAAAPNFVRPSVGEEPAHADTRPGLAVKAVSAMDAHLGGTADRFTEDDARTGITDPAAFYADWLKRNRPGHLHKRPYHMLSDIEKARVAVFLAVANG